MKKKKKKIKFLTYCLYKKLKNLVVSEIKFPRKFLRCPDREIKFPWKLANFATREKMFLVNRELMFFRGIEGCQWPFYFSNLFSYETNLFPQYTLGVLRAPVAV